MMSTRNQSHLPIAPASSSNSTIDHPPNHQQISESSHHTPQDQQGQQDRQDSDLSLPEDDEETDATLFNAGVMRLDNNECGEFLKCCSQLLRLKELYPQVQQLYQQHQRRIFSEVALRQKIERSLNAIERLRKTFPFDLWLIRKICGRYLANRDAFRNAMKSRFVQRTVASLLNVLQIALVNLHHIRAAIHMRLSDHPIDDYDAVAHYMARVHVCFISEYNTYATGLSTSEQTDEDKAKLSGQVCAVSFHSTRSLGALFCHIQHVRGSLQQTEQTFLDNWFAIPTKHVNEITWNLALLNDIVHSLRRSCMIFMALAMRVVDDDDQFFQFCRSQEERILETTNNVYLAQRRLEKVKEMITTDLNSVDDAGGNNAGEAVKSMPVVLDPVEERAAQMELRLIPGSYKVFVGHDDTEDCLEMAERVTQELNGVAISTYTESRLDVDHVPFLSEGTERALFDACVGVFFLSADLARKKNKVEQLRIMLRRVREARLGWPGVILIPVFYKLSVAECRYSEQLSEMNGDGTLRSDEEWSEIREIFKDITGYTGIENVEHAGVGDSEDMKGRRTRLVERICEAVTEACMTAKLESLTSSSREANGGPNEEDKEFLKELKAKITQSRQQQEALLEQSVGANPSALKRVD